MNVHARVFNVLVMFQHIVLRYHRYRSRHHRLSRDRALFLPSLMEAGRPT